MDPLTHDYSELAPYQFSANRVNDAIELEGLEAFFIHGTASKSTRWIENEEGNEDYDLVNGLFEITNNKMYDITFDWTKKPNGESLNGMLNDEADRKNAATMLVSHVMNYRKKNEIDKYDEKGELVSLGSEPITLIGHSHGGNVAIQAARMLKKNYKLSTDIITIATPAFNSDKSKEKPHNVSGIRKLISIYNLIDGVSGGLSGDDYYNTGPSSRKKILRIEIDASKDGNIEWLDAHSYDAYHMEDFIKQLKENPNSAFLKKDEGQKNKKKDEKKKL